MNPILPRAWLTILITLILAAFLAINSHTGSGIPIRNNIMELLPALRDDPVLLQALQRSNKAVSNKLLILVGDPDTHTTDQAATLVEKSLQDQNFFSAPLTGISPQQVNAIGQFYYQWRSFLLGKAQRHLLQANDLSGFESQLTQTLYSPVSGISSELLRHDPLLTFYHFMRSLPQGQGKIQSVNGKLLVQGVDRQYRVIMVDIEQDVFDMSLHPHYQQWRSGLYDKLQTQYPETQLMLMGAIQHAVWGANSAKQEVSTIGNGSLLGIIALVAIVFRSGRTLLLSLLPIFSGIVAGMMATLLCFREIHLITLVFGSSVIGVAMDYSLHYFCEHYKNTPQEKNSYSQSVIKQIFPGITMAMLTSVIAYAAIGFAPFPVLRQVALFSCTGLAAAWLTVISLYPRLTPRASFHHPRYLQWSEWLDKQLRQLFARRHSRIALMLLAAAMLPGLLNLTSNDDLRLLQARETGLSATDKQIQSLTGIQTDGRFFLIEGETLEQLLQRTEQLDNWLDTHKLSGDLLSHYQPSEQRQQENFQLLEYLHVQLAEHWHVKLGLSQALLAQAAVPFQKKPSQWLDHNALLASPLNTAMQRFQLAETDRGLIAAGFIKNADGTNGESLSSLLAEYTTTHEGIHWMDPVGDISNMFKHYREQTGVMMLLAYALIAALLCWRYHPTHAWRVMLAPALAAWFTLGLLGYAGVSINLFHVLALLLVLGVGIDYSIFFAESHTHRDATMLAVILSTATTLLSFGLLALSATAAIRSFGIVVSIGMVCALIFSPLAQHQPQNSH